MRRILNRASAGSSTPPLGSGTARRLASAPRGRRRAARSPRPGRPGPTPAGSAAVTAVGSHLEALQREAAEAAALGERGAAPRRAVDAAADAAAVRLLGQRVRAWLQRELAAFLLGLGERRGEAALGAEAVVLPAAGAHLAGDALAVSDCDFVVLHGPSLADPTIWAGRDGFLAHLRSNPCVYEPRRVAFRDVDNLQCVLIVPHPLGDSGTAAAAQRGVYVRVDIARVSAAVPLSEPGQQRAVGRLLGYLGDAPAEGAGDCGAEGLATVLPQLSALPELSDSTAIRRLHSVCLNRHSWLTSTPESRELARALKAVAWVHRLYPSRPQRRRGVPGLGWRLLVSQYTAALASGAPAPAGGLGLAQLCDYFVGLAAERRAEGGGLYVAPTLSLPDATWLPSPAAASASALPGICLPLVWDEVIASHQQPTVDVCRHLNAVGWRELEDFFRVVAADGERSQDSIHPGWAAARAACSLDAVSFSLADHRPAATTI